MEKLANLNDLHNSIDDSENQQLNNENKIAKKRGRKRKQINLNEEFNDENDSDSNIKMLRPRKRINLCESSDLTSESGGSDLTIKRVLRPRKQKQQEFKTTKVLRPRLNKTIETTKPKKNLNKSTKFTRSVAKLRNYSDKNNDSDATIIDTNFNNDTTDDEIDNFSELMNNDENSNDENQIRSVNKLNKRKFSDVDNDHEIDYQELNEKKQKNDYFYVFIELQVTGMRSNEDIIKFCAYINQTKKMAYYIFPKRKRLINKMSDLNKMWIGNRMMTDNGLICNYEDLSIVLSEFVKLIEEINNDKIIFVFENSFQLQHLQYILLNNLRDLNLLEKIENKLAGFIDCSKLFCNDKKKFSLELEAKNSKIISNLTSQDPLYRLNLLIRFFCSKYVKYVLKNQDNFIEDYEIAKQIADSHYDYYIKMKNQLDEDDEYAHLKTIDDILSEAKIINETKNFLTSDELIYLYSYQKLQYQFINSSTYKPYASCPRDKPRKKNQELDQFQNAVIKSNLKNTMSTIFSNNVEENDEILENDVINLDNDVINSDNDVEENNFSIFDDDDQDSNTNSDLDSTFTINSD